MFKKIGILFILLLPLVLTSCGISYLSLLKDDLPSEDIKLIYNNKTIEAYEYQRDLLDYLIQGIKLNIKEDTETSDAEKKLLLNRIKEFEIYESNRFYGLIMQSRNPLIKDEPILKSSLNLKFSITTVNNTSLILDVMPYAQKNSFVTTSQFGGSHSSVDNNYWWFIKTKMPIDNKHFSDADKPINLVITYPNGKKQIYSILKK